MYFKRDHLPTLDGLRGLAVILVLWSHMPKGTFGAVGDALSFIVRPGYLGVDVFFVLSGFLITRILLTDRARERPLRHFMIRRFVRIFPIYYLLIAILLIFDPGEHLAWCATYLSNFYFSVNKSPSPMEHTWSLAVEEHFYLFWPLAVYALPVAASRRLALWGLIPTAFALSIATAAFESHLPAEADSIIYRVTFYRMISLALGAVFAFIEPNLREQPARILKLAAALFAPAVVVIPAVLLVDHQWVGPFVLVGFAGLSGAIFLATLAANEFGGAGKRALSSPSLSFAGRISYGLYLYHLPIFFLLGVWGYPKDRPPGTGLVALAVGLSIGIATLSYYAVEKPLLRWVAGWTRGPSPSVPPPLEDPTGPDPLTAR